MKVIKPFRLSVVTRAYEVRRQPYVGVSTFLFFDLRTGELLPEVAMWQFAAEQLGKDAGLDAGVPKRNAEVIVHGSVFTPEGEPQTTCPATVKLGALEKTIYAIGDRHWRDDEQSAPQPFTVMPITWERAFGGEGFAPNVSGKGHAPVETEHGPIQFLPNLELPGRMIERPSDTPEPACFGPLDLTRPQRLDKAGTYDEEWLKELFPGCAADIDWTFWNVAPEDQQQPEPWRGDEPFELRHLHPTEAKIVGRLPGLRARTFVTLRDAEDPDALLELENRLTTVWFFPHAEKAILVYQGATRVREDDATDVTLLFLAAERLGAPRPMSHYQQVLAQRLDKDEAIFHVLRDDELLPPDLIESFSTPDEVDKMKALVTRDDVMQKRLTERMRREVEATRELIRSHGLDPDEHGPSQPEAFEPPPIAEVPRLMAKLEQDARDQLAAKELEIEEKIREGEALMESHGVDPSFLRAELDDPQVGPPTFSAEAELERIRGLDAQARASGLVLDEIQEWLADAELHARWKTAETAIRDAYVQSAHFQREAPRMDPETAARTRDAVLAALHRGEPMAHRDLTGADLSGLDLRGADFAKGWLESVDLRGSNLEGADFSECVLARADLTGAYLAGVKLRGANLGGAKLVGARGGPGLDLTEAILMKADLTDADFAGAVLDRANLSNAVFARTSFGGVSAIGLFFYQTDLRGASFAGSRLGQGTFVECNLGGVDFSGTALDRVTFLQCEAPGIRLAAARTEKLVVCLAGSFEGADFRGAQLLAANLRETRLRGADFSEALLDGADLSEADLREAKLYRAVAKGARFAKANLEDADLTSANLMEADLSRSDLSGASLKGANLYGANFAKVRTRVEADLTDALQRKVTIYPLWRAPT
ncbi:MAG: DUF2169 domain-containing protein [Sandaracinaceae bacterium]